MLKVLFIDDEPKSVETVIEELESKIDGVECEKVGFDVAESTLRIFLPDVVVLDILKGTIAEKDRAGLLTCDFIWEKCFCPIVFYSAIPDDVKSEVKKHPFVRLVQKGSGSEAEVISYVQEFLPHIEALNSVQNEIRQHVNHQLRYIAPLIFTKITEEEKRKSVLVRASRRRIAAMMDEPLSETIACWEQYLCPPVGSSLMAGDIIMRRTGDKNDPSKYRIILTPSCDLVNSGNQRPKVEKVLVAHCTQIDEILSDMNLSARARVDKLKGRVLSFLTRGHGTFCLPLPELPGILPQMAANLKYLELIELNKIGNSDQKEYLRVVSVDSPFREMIIWAYVQITGRPGLPERDFEPWVEDIVSAVVPEGIEEEKE